MDTRGEHPPCWRRPICSKMMTFTNKFLMYCRQDFFTDFISDMIWWLWSKPRSPNDLDSNTFYAPQTAPSRSWNRRRPHGVHCAVQQGQWKGWASCPDTVTLSLYAGGSLLQRTTSQNTSSGAKLWQREVWRNDDLIMSTVSVHYLWCRRLYLQSTLEGWQYLQSTLEWCLYLQSTLGWWLYLQSL